jgi:ribosome assembly protein 3
VVEEKTEEEAPPAKEVEEPISVPAPTPTKKEKMKRTKPTPTSTSPDQDTSMEDAPASSPPPATIKPTSTKTTSKPKPQPTEDFSAIYLRKIASEFADDLDKVREAQDFKASSVPMLIHALKQGESLFSTEETRRVVGAAGLRKKSVGG